MRRQDDGALLTCPSCGRSFDAHGTPWRQATAWRGGLRGQAICPDCGTVFAADTADATRPE